MAKTPESPGTGVGVSRLAVVPSPSWPCKFHPQQLTEASERTAQVWPGPPAVTPVALKQLPISQRVEQVRPQPPQFPMSTLRSTQVPPHTLCPVGHSHLPATQVAPVAHTLSQLPQFVVVARSTQTPAQGPAPVGHSHLPATQVAPVAHTLSQLPQLALSVVRSLHTSPHADLPLGHAQLPAAHSHPERHALPQLPQCFALV